MKNEAQDHAHILRRHLPATTALLALSVLLTVLVTAPSAQSETFKVLHAFGGPLGAVPFGSLVRDAKGNLYGTTFWGGAFNFGTVFMLDSAGKGRLIYSFTGGSDGGHPYAGLLRDSAGNLYGTTKYGGAFNAGTVFRINAKGTETVLYTFTGGADGGTPVGGVIRDAAGNFYGTTQLGGGGSCHGVGCGVVFKLDPSGTETVLHTFTGGADGGYPLARLIRDPAGNLYGTTQIGGNGADTLCSTADGGCGTVFKVDGDGNQTVLYSFSWGVGVDGGLPVGGLVMDAAGNLYGTNTVGGDNKACLGFGCGTVFKVDNNGTETVLHSFTDPPEGADPSADLVRDAAGNLYGTTYDGGNPHFGTVFKLDTTGKETVLYTFQGGKDGGYPTAGLVRDAAGNLYGTASNGGIGREGVVFVIKP